MRNFENPVDAEGETILHEAAKYGQIEILKKIYEKQNQLEVRDQNGQTPLHKAVRYGQIPAWTRTECNALSLFFDKQKQTQPKLKIFYENSNFIRILNTNAS